MKDNLRIKIVSCLKDKHPSLNPELRMATATSLIDSKVRKVAIKITNTPNVAIRFEFTHQFEEKKVSVQAELPRLYIRDSNPETFAKTLDNFDLVVLDMTRPIYNFTIADIKQVLKYIRGDAPVVPIVFLFQSHVQSCFQLQFESLSSQYSAFSIYVNTPKYFTVIIQSLTFCFCPTQAINTFNNQRQRNLSFFSSIFYTPAQSFGSIINKIASNKTYKDLAQKNNWVDVEGKLTETGMMHTSDEEIFFSYIHGFFDTQKIKSATKICNSELTP